MSEEIDLTNKKCLPCEGGIDAIDKKQANYLIKKLDKGWSLTDDSKKFTKILNLKITMR